MGATKAANTDFNPSNSMGLEKAGLNSFVLTAKQWAEKANVQQGLSPKQGRYGGTFMPITTLLSSLHHGYLWEFRLYLIKEFQRLIEKERGALGWDRRAKSCKNKL